MSAAAQWLGARAPAPPPPLAAALQAAVQQAQDSSVPNALLDAAERELARALELGDTRAAAFPLLTADALLTYVLEAAAEQGVVPLDAMIERCAARLAAMDES